MNDDPQDMEPIEADSLPSPMADFGYKTIEDASVDVSVDMAGISDEEVDSTLRAIKKAGAKAKSNRERLQATLDVLAGTAKFATAIAKVIA